MADNTQRVAQYRVKGFTEDVNVCGFCGRNDLKGTVVMRELDIEGNEVDTVYAGTGCAAEVGRWTQRQVKDELNNIERAAREAAQQERREQDAREAAVFVAWVNETYGAAATTRSEAFDAACAATGLTPFKVAKLHREATSQTPQTSKETKMRNWTAMTAGDFYTGGDQLDLFAAVEGDGYGTIALDEIADQVPVEVERADGALFGLALADAPADADVLFAVVAA